MKNNVFVRIWKKICKFFSDTKGELKKVSWTPKAELSKSSKLVIISVIAVCISIAVIDLCSSWLINTIAGLIG
jgi:preprotein translocase SecE subunit